MFVRITTDSAPRPNSLRDLGMTSASNSLVNLSEFSYKKGSEIYGEKEPADYVYQVKSGAVRSYKLLSDGRRQIGAFISPATSSAWRTVESTASRQRRSSIPMCASSSGKASRSWPRATPWWRRTC